MPATDLALEQEDEEGEEIEDCDEGEWKHTLLSSSCRLEPEDREQAAERGRQQVNHHGRGAASPETEICNESRARERSPREDVDDEMKEGKYGEYRDGCGHKGDSSGRGINEPDEVDARLAAELGAVKQVEYCK